MSSAKSRGRGERAVGRALRRALAGTDEGASPPVVEALERIERIEAFAANPLAPSPSADAVAERAELAFQLAHDMVAAWRRPNRLAGEAPDELPDLWLALAEPLDARDPLCAGRLLAAAASLHG
ncbi:MAG TPA: hypothetical protein VHF22_15015 [Planctomycetota bacterium]|nr:hypothetical protein [Planctomycetota bacterium]